MKASARTRQKTSQSRAGRVAGRAARDPLGRSDKWRLRLIATAAALLLGIGIYFLQHLPAARNISDEQATLTATSTRTLALYNLHAASLMQFDGALGAGLRATFSTGRPTATTRDNLKALALQLPNVKGAHIQWQGKPAPTGRISVRISNGRQAPDAGMMLQATGSGNIVELNIRAVQTALTAEIDVASQDPNEVPSAELKFGDANLLSPGLAFAPLQFEIPPGASLNLTFDSEDALANSTFRLGELLGTGGSATALPVGRVAVGRLSDAASYPSLRSVLRGVCSAPAGKLLLASLTPKPEDCAIAATPQDQNLYADEIVIKPRRVDLTLEGSGFVITDGHAEPAGFFAGLTSNPLIAALLGGLVFAVVRPLWRLWTGREM